MKPIQFLLPIIGLTTAALLATTVSLVQQRSSVNFARTTPTKVKVCHILPDNPNGVQIIQIDQQAWIRGLSEHSLHRNDYLIENDSECVPSSLPTPDLSITPSATTSGLGKIKICHVPPGSPQNSQAIEISLQAWETGHNPHNAHNLDYVITAAKGCPPPVIPIPTSTSTPSATPTSTSE